MKKGVQRLRRGKTGLAVIDIQERLLPSIFEHERVVQNTIRLIKGLRVIGRPVFLTEQYPKGLGSTVAEVAAACGASAPLEKVVFSACGAAAFNAALKKTRISDVLLCGIEAHVCVLQTCLDLLEQDFGVFVVADAVS